MWDQHLSVSCLVGCGCVCVALFVVSCYLCQISIVREVRAIHNSIFREILDIGHIVDPLLQTRPQPQINCLDTCTSYTSSYSVITHQYSAVDVWGNVSEIRREEIDNLERHNRKRSP